MKGAPLRKIASTTVSVLLCSFMFGADYCNEPIGSGACANVITMTGDGEQVTTLTFETKPTNISSNFNITGIPVCYRAVVDINSATLTVNWDSEEYYEQYAGNINALLFYNNTASSGECRFQFTGANGKAYCGEPPVKPAITTNLTESYAYRGVEVVLTAINFDEGSSYVWESAESESGPWSTLSGTGDEITVIPMIAGNNYYRVTGLKDGADKTAKITILAKIACNENASQRVLWEETFDDNVFTDPYNDRFECQWVTGYEFASWDCTCGAGEGKRGKVCDGYYVVVSNSSAAGPESYCGWPQEKFDHTSGDGTSGFLIINAGTPKKIMYEQAIMPQTGFCPGVFYNFSLFATNIASAETSPARFSFDIVEIKNDGTELYLVKEHDSGQIQGNRMESWYEYGVSFEPQDVENIREIVVRIWNTGASDNGNDVVIDDISVSVCSPTAEAFIGDRSEGKKYERSVSCGTALEMNAEVNGVLSDFFSSTPYYVWQKRVIGSDWVTIEGEHSKTYQYLTNAGEAANIRCLIASDENTANLVISGAASTGCGIYAWTDEVFATCVDDCYQLTKIKLDATYPAGSTAETYMVGGDGVSLEAKTIEGVQPWQYEWYVNNNLTETSESATYLVKPYTDMTVKVVASSRCNKSDDRIEIKVLWPTIVTPYDGDGKNDDFATGMDIHIKLFDRIGNMVYEGPDGLPVDAIQNLQPAVYFYQAVMPDNTERRGTVEVYH